MEFAILYWIINISNNLAPALARDHPAAAVGEERHGRDLGDDRRPRRGLGAHRDGAAAGDVGHLPVVRPPGKIVGRRPPPRGRPF